MEVSTAYPTPIKSVAATDQQKNDKNYDTFLKMMTTQIKNQDPLNPMSADQLAVQLATFPGSSNRPRPTTFWPSFWGKVR
jgi:flagellar basal-body rod modification protein FlgD